jgi:protease IV
MSADSDYLVDRRRLKRRVGFWRAAAFVVAAVAVIGAGLYAGRDRLGASGLAGAHVARVRITGVITGDDNTLDLLKRVGKGNAAAVLVEIESPGGTVTGSESLYDGLRELSAKKPTVAVVNGLAASGGYIAAMGTDRIVAQQTSIVGSIGVLFQSPNVSKLLENWGVTMDTIKSAPLKASPNPLEPTTPAAREAMAAVINDSFDWFKAVVQERRGISGPDLASVSDGRVFTGRQAIGLKLIDEVGTEKTAIAWLEANKGVAKDLPVREWKRRDDRTFGLFSMASGAAGAMGYGQLAATLGALGRAGDQPVLDGVLALWHP